MYLPAALFLGFGLYLSICIWIFLIVSDAVAKLTAIGFFKPRRIFSEAVERHFDALRAGFLPTAADMEHVFSRLGNAGRRKHFLKRFIHSVDNIPEKPLIQRYIAEAWPHLGRFLHFRENEHYAERSYRLMLLGEFRQNSVPVNAFLFKHLKDESFEVRTNALKAIAIIGDPGWFARALATACDSVLYFNPRHITDALACFEGDPDDLVRRMLEIFDLASARYRYNMIVFLTERRIRGYMDFVIDCLQKRLDEKEVAIACLRYFIACDASDVAIDVIRSLFSAADTDIRAVLVKLVPRYFRYDAQIASRLLSRDYLRSRDWHVRKNSAAAFVQSGLAKEHLLKWLPADDPYARDALIYAMFSDGLLSFEEYDQLKGEKTA